MRYTANTNWSGIATAAFTASLAGYIAFAIATERLWEPQFWVKYLEVVAFATLSLWGLRCFLKRLG